MTFVAGDTGSCMLVIPSDVLRCLLLQVALVASQTRHRAQDMAEEANVAGQANFRPLQGPEHVLSLLSDLRWLSVEDRVRIIHEIMQEPSNDIPHLSCAYVLWRLNTMWGVPLNSNNSQETGRVMRIISKLLATPVASLVHAVMDWEHIYGQDIYFRSNVQALWSIQCHPPTHRLPSPIHPMEVLATYRALLGAEPRLRQEAVEWISQHPEVPWAQQVIFLIRNLPVLFLPDPQPRNPARIALFAAGLITSGYTVAAGHAATYKCFDYIPMTKETLLVVFRAINEAAESTFLHMSWPMQ